MQPTNAPAKLPDLMQLYQKQKSISDTARASSTLGILLISVTIILMCVIANNMFYNMLTADTHFIAIIAITIFGISGVSHIAYAPCYIKLEGHAGAGMLTRLHLLTAILVALPLLANLAIDQLPEGPEERMKGLVQIITTMILMIISAAGTLQWFAVEQKISATKKAASVTD